MRTSSYEWVSGLGANPGAARDARDSAPAGSLALQGPAGGERGRFQAADSASAATWVLACHSACHCGSCAAGMGRAKK